MIEGIAILAIGAAILLYVEMKSNKKTIEQQDYKKMRKKINSSEMIITLTK